MDNKDPKNNGGNQSKGPQTLIILLVAGIITMLLFSLYFVLDFQRMTLNCYLPLWLRFSLHCHIGKVNTLRRIQRREETHNA